MELTGFILQLAQLLDENVSQVGLSSAARELGYSVRSLQRHLAAAGTSFRLEFQRVRLDRARRFLLESNLSMSEVASQLGFASPEAFIRDFRRQVGVSPGAWRRAARQESKDCPPPAASTGADHALPWPSRPRAG